MSTKKVSRKSSKKTIKKVKKLSEQKQKLLNIYYNKEFICDHLWIDYDFYYNTDEEHLKLDHIISSLEEFSKNTNPALIVHIDSRGGNVSVGHELYNLLHNFNKHKPIITIVEHECMSAAIFPFLAGNLRIFKPYCLFLIHQLRVTYESQIKFKALRRELYDFQLMYNDQINFIKQHTSLSELIIKDFLKSEKYLSYSDALKYNVVHHIFDPKKIKKLNFLPTDEATNKVFTIYEFLKFIKFLTDPQILRTKKINKLIVYTDSSFGEYWHYIKNINIMLEIPIDINFIIPTSILNGPFLMSLFAKKTSIIKTLAAVDLYSETKLNFGDNIQSTLEDKIIRTNIFRQIIISILKQKTKFSPKILKDLLYKTFNFRLDDIIKYNLVDEVIDLDQDEKIKQYGSAYKQCGSAFGAGAMISYGNSINYNNSNFYPISIAKFF